ncbi:MAG: alpha/beta fold hydrolase [Angustibacter sp.]
MSSPDPAESPRAQGLLDVGDGQRVYWEERGARDGVPALYLHGGPGSGLGASAYRRRFDLSRTRLVALEQRGCGRSTPHASEPSTSLRHNDTAHLVADIEVLRRHLGIDAWLVSGASWGCTLALAYAQAHPERVLGLVGYAVTTTSRREVDWITEGVGAIFPEAWDRLASHAEAAGIGYRRGQGRLVEAYAALMESGEERVRDAASRQWALWEDTHVSIATGGVHRDPRWDSDRFRWAFTRLTTHYWSHDGFADPPLLDRTDRLHDVPGTLLHGRKDVSSPLVTAWRLHRAWPGSRLVVDEGAGHGGAAMGDLWRREHDAMLDRLGG